MDTSPNLQLTYLMAAQSQKHVTYNEAMRALDALVQQMVLDQDLADPPRIAGRRRPLTSSPHPHGRLGRAGRQNCGLPGWCLAVLHPA
jgi:hypothetical protein